MLLEWQATLSQWGIDAPRIHCTGARQVAHHTAAMRCSLEAYTQRSLKARKKQGKTLT